MGPTLSRVFTRISDALVQCSPSILQTNAHPQPGAQTLPQSHHGKKCCSIGHGFPGSLSTLSYILHNLPCTLSSLSHALPDTPHHCPIFSWLSWYPSSLSQVLHDPQSTPHSYSIMCKRTGPSPTLITSMTLSKYNMVPFYWN